MHIWNNVTIREKQHTILTFLYMYRGATNEQIRRFIYPHLESKPSGQLANISRFVSNLKKKGLVKSVSCHPYAKSELNFLSLKGIEYILEHIESTGHKDGQLPGFKHEGYHGTFEYDILKPPTQYIEHHLMYADVVVDFMPFGSFRNNLYAVKEYEQIVQMGNRAYKKRAKIKPDGEFLHPKGPLLAIEIDTGSERTERLTSKFDNYRRYFDYCLENNQKIPWKGILFHTKRGYESLKYRKMFAGKLY